MKHDCLWSWKQPWNHVFPCENIPNIASVSLIEVFISQWRVSALLSMISFTAQASLVQWLFLGASGMIFPPASSLHFSSPGKKYHKYLLNTTTSTQEMFKNHDAYNRENKGGINLIPHTHINVNTNVDVGMCKIHKGGVWICCAFMHTKWHPT